MKVRKYTLFLISLLVGLLAYIQYRSFQEVQALVTRDNEANIFGHLQILKNTNEQLQKEIRELENQIQQSSDQAATQQLVREEIEKFKLLLGRVDVQGPGLRLSIEGKVDAIWLTDIINDLWNSQAEAISINQIRLTTDTSGFSQVGDQQILLSGNLLTPPYFVEAIGDKKLLEKALTQAGGIITRFKEAYPTLEVSLEQQEVIVMKKI